MGDDHLDKETSISAELTEAGVKASAKSRIVAAFDRLGGNLFELINVPIEARNTEKRAKMEARVEAIKALTSAGVEKLKSNPEFAERALAAHYGSIFEKQDNKDGVLHAALNDLRRQPPNEEQATTGPQAIGEEFMGKFERYAEEATSDELREKWGRVLAGEIRKPGTFSGKVQRVIDELDGSTAKLFEDLCRYRLGPFVPRCLTDYSEMQFEALVGAELVVVMGMGQTAPMQLIDNADTIPQYLRPMGRGFGIGVLKETEIPKSVLDPTVPLKRSGETIGVPVVVLTAVGQAIATILEHSEFEAFSAYVRRLREYIAAESVIPYEQLDGTYRRIVVQA